MNQITTPSEISPKGSGICYEQKVSPFARWLGFLCLFLTAGVLMPSRSSALSITVGTGGTSTSNQPLMSCMGYSYSQQIYLASDLVAGGATGGAGFLSTISFNMTSYPGSWSASKDWVVYLGNTSTSTFATSSSWLPVSGLTKVFDGVTSFSATGWYTITFSTPFYWDGTSNLVVAVDENTSSWNCTASFAATSRTGTRSMVAYSDPTNMDPAAPPSASATFAGTPDIKLDYLPATPCGSTVTGGTAIASATTLCPGGSVGLNNTGATAATGLTYVWDSSATGTGGWAPVSAVLTGPAFTFTPPSGRTLYYRMRITCTATGATATSTTVSVTASSVLTPTYIQDFESGPVNVNVPCAAVTGTWEPTSYYYGYYWDLKSGTSSYPSITNHTAAPGSSKYLWAGAYVGVYGLGTPSGNQQYWYTPGLQLYTGKTYRFSYWYVNSGYSGYACNFGMVYNTSQSATGATTIKADFNDGNTVYKKNEGDFTVGAAGVYYLGVKINQPSFNYYGTAIDDIMVQELPDCNTATAGTFGAGGKATASPNVICSTPGTTTLSVGSTPPFSGLSFSWEVAAGTPTTFTAAGITAASGSYTITTGGAYYFRCKVICTSTGLSSYSDTVKVTTTPIPPPYREDFEAGASGVNMPCASFTGSFSAGTTSGWDLRTGPFDATYAPGIKNHTPGGSKYLFGGYYMGSYAGTVARYWFTPGLALTAAKAYDFSFWVSNNGYYPSSYPSSSIELGVRIGNAQTETAMTIAAGADTVIAPNAVSTATYNQVHRGFIAPTTGTYYVGIRFNALAAAYPGVAFDDIGLDQLPPCAARPAAGTARAIPALICGSGSTTLSLLGTSVASDLTFQWQESATGATGSFTDIAGANTPGYTTVTLTAARYYRCVIVCPLIAAPRADTSTVIKVNVTPIVPPYIEDFETGTAGVNMPCASAAGGSTVWSAGSLLYWDLREGPYSSYPSITNHTPGGKKYLYSGYYNGPYYGPAATGDNYFWFTPGLALTGGKSYKCSFWFSSNGYASSTPGFKAGIYAGTAQTAAGMTIRAGGLDTNLNVMSGGYRQIVRSFTAPVTGTYYVGIKTVHTGYNYPGVPIDDIGIDQNPSCAGKPAAGIADASPALICSSGTSKMRLSGTSAVSDLAYQWLESTTGATGPWVAATGGSGATAADFTTPTLSAARWYRCVVTCTVSGLSDTSSVAVVNAGAIIPPYRETFESVMPGTNAACASNSSTWGTSSSTTYWTTKGFPYTGYGMIYNNHTPGGANYLWGGYYFGYSPSAGAMWFTPAIQLVKDSTYEFSYWYQGPAYYYYNSGVELGMYYGTAQTEAAMTNLVRPLFIDKRSEYKQLIGRFKAVGTGNYYMGIKVRHTYSTYSYYGTAIDDIGLDQLAPCTGKPTAGVIASKPDMLCSAGTVALDMDYTGVTKASGLSYRWEWTNTDPTGGAFIAAGSSTAAAAPNLTSPSISATTWFRCVVKCTYSGDSAISAPIKVDVGIVTPPYIQTFEGVDQGVNAPCASNTYTFSPSSWLYWGVYRVPLSTSYPAIYNHTAGGTAYLLAGYGMKYSSGADEYWFTPRIQLTGGKMYQFSYWYSGSGYSGGKANLSAAYGITNTAAGMTVPIGTALVDVNESDYKQYAGTFTPGTSGAYYLGIKIAHTTYAYPGIAIDDIGLQEVPPCSSTVVAGKINSVPVHLCDAGGTATLNLTGSTLATGLTYQWMSSSLEAGPYTAAGTGLPFATAPLTATTWFKVIVTCTASGKADTSAAFRMGVGGFELPYSEDFESTPTGQKPLCSDATAWGMYYYDGWNVYAGTYTGMYTNHTPGGKKHLIGGYYLGYATYSPTYTTVTDENYWFTPGFNMRGGYKYKLSFWYLGASSGYKNRMGVFYGGSQSPGAMTKTIIPFTLVSNTDYVQADTTFTVATTGVYYLGFKKSSGTLGAYNYYGVAFDDINLNYAPCDGTPTAGTITGSVASGTGLCKGTPVQLRSAGATVKLVPGIRYRWQRRGLPGAPVNWTNVPGAIDTMLSSDSLIGYEYRLAVICHNTHDTVYTPAYQLPQLPPHPPVVISPSSSPIMYCLGDTVHLNATYYAGAVYDWRLEGASVAGWKFSDMGATEPGTYTVKITSALSPCPGYSNAVKLVANDPGYKVDITLPSDSVLCSGSSVVLTAVASKPGVTFQWRRNNIDIPGETGTTYMVTTGGYYRVAVFDGASSCPAVSRNILFIVKPNPPAVITIPGGTLTACEEVGVQLDANLGGFSYQWSRSGSPVFGWVDSSVKATTSGVYSVKVRSADGCASVSADVNVTILPSPVPTIGRMGVYPSITLTATPTSYVSYTWMRTGTGGTGIEGTGNPLAVTKKGTYKVIVEDVNGCKGESAPLEILDEGLSVGNVSLIDIRVFPNPTQAKVYIESPVAVKVTVKDAAGKTVIDQSVVKEIDLGKYADGIYLFELRDVKTEQLVKQQRVNKVTK